MVDSAGDACSPTVESSHKSPLLPEARKAILSRRGASNDTIPEQDGAEKIPAPIHQTIDAASYEDETGRKRSLSLKKAAHVTD